MIGTMICGMVNTARKIAYSIVDSVKSRTIRLIAKPDIAFPSMEMTLPMVMIVKSLVQSVFSVFMALFYTREQKIKVSTANIIVLTY